MLGKGMIRTIAILAVLAVAAPSSAQLVKGVRLKAEEATKALFGIDMEGFSPTENMEWRECIQPNGETLYEIPKRVLKGQLRISKEGQACFSYNDTDYQVEGCFWVVKTDKGFRFESDGSVFITTVVVTGVKSCKPEALVS
jgi:hypothetical protein